MRKRDFWPIFLIKFVSLLSKIPYSLCIDGNRPRFPVIPVCKVSARPLKNVFLSIFKNAFSRVSERVFFDSELELDTVGMVIG